MFILKDKRGKYTERNSRDEVRRQTQEMERGQKGQEMTAAAAETIDHM